MIVAWQFPIPGLVAFKPVAYKKTKCNQWFTSESTVHHKLLIS